MKTLHFKRERGIADPFTLTLLAAGLILGVYLVGQRTNLFPRAQTPIEPPAQFLAPTTDIKIKKDLPSKPPENLQEKPDKGVICIQVITPAKNTATGECREFPTPCDVPNGWKKVSSCPTPSPSSIATQATGQVKCEKDINCGVGKRCEQPNCPEPAIYCPPGTDQTPCQLRACPKVCVDDPTYCAQDVKACPNGSSVSRILPNCDFAPCPFPTPQACTLNDLRAAYFARRGDPKYNPACDANNDGRISLIDYSVLLKR